MTIRPYQESDNNQIIKLMSEFGDFIESIDQMQRTQYALNGSEYFTNKLLKDVKKNKGEIFVAEDKGKIVGFIGGYIGRQDEEELMEAKKSTPGLISEFFVTKQFRSTGIGSKLLNQMENFLKDGGCDLIRLEVFAPNKLARDFYKSKGYQDRLIIVSKVI